MLLTFLVALVYASITVNTASAALTQVTGLTASANGYDDRMEDWGCAPSGCLPSNAIDGSLEYASRWSCIRYLIDGYNWNDNSQMCELTLDLPTPTDIKEVRAALWKGHKRSRSFNIVADGEVTGNLTSSGTTEIYETYDVTAMLASKIVLQAQDTSDDNSWFSLLEIQLMTESEVVTSTPIEPTDSGYIGCYADMISDRVMTSALIMPDLTPEACSAVCADMGKFYYSLQQGNECWCAGCQLTDFETTTDYDRHGLGTCNVPCAGDPSASCGGDMSFSLYQSGSCVATPAPTPPIPDSGCPAGSIQSSLEVTLSYEGVERYLELNVEEPSGTRAIDYDKGDVGVISSFGSYDDPGMKYQTYTLMNDLDITEDPVLGDYTVWVRGGEEGEEYLLTARAGGELLWAVGGVVGFDPWDDDQPTYTATITEYEESDCKTETYGECPYDTVSSDGAPPCAECPLGDVTVSSGATECVLGALAYLDLPQSVADAIVTDAVGGFAGPGWVEFDDRVWRHVLLEEDANVLSLAGTFERWDDIDPTIPASTAVFAYLYKEDDPDAFLSSQGTIIPSTGSFTVILEDVPAGEIILVLSFAILDSADAPPDMGTNTVFDYEVANVGCGNALTLTLEWDLRTYLVEWSDSSTYSTSEMDLWITEPTGAEMPWDESTIGFHSGYSTYPIVYTVYGDNPDAVGTYKIEVYESWVPHGTVWTLTAEVRGEVLWVETGVREGFLPTTSSGSYNWNYRNDITELELILDDASRYEC